MSPSEDKLEALFHQALKFGPAERAAFLVGACGDDHELRRRLEELLRAEAEAGAFLPEAPQEAVTLEAEAHPCEEEKIGSHIGRYKLLEKIGEGGFGEVWLAEQKEPIRRKVALKVIKLGMDTRQVVARFEAERQALALMDHPNIAKVLDGGATELGRPYFVMELVRGIPITQYCDENRLPTEKRLRLFIQVCQAIQHAHQKGIIHRDIKPSNILVTVNDGVPVPKVIDFGIAKAMQQELTEKTVYTHLQQFIGTPAYMSPEQSEITSLDIDTRSDIYSLGVLLYELLVGRTPFDSKELLQLGLDAMRRTIREKDPVRPSTRIGSLPDEERTTTARHRAAEPPKLISLLRGDLDCIVMKCLEKDRTQRYETANGLAMDVQRFQNSEPVVARPHSLVYQFQKFVRRNRVIVTAAATVAVVLMLGIFASTWQAIRASRLRQRAEANEMKAREAAEKETEQRREAQAQEIAARRNLYAAEMVLAYQALEAGNLGYARKLIETYTSTSSQRDLRGWEWRYLWRQCKSDELFTLGAHAKGVTVAAFFPDGQTVASASKDKTVKLWNLSPRQLIAEIPHSHQVHGLAISPDGKHFASGSDDGIIRLWDAATRREMLTFTNSPDVQCLMFSNDGKFLAAAGSRRVAVWDVSTHAECLQVPGNFGSPGWKIGLTLSPDNRHVAFGWDNIQVWDILSKTLKTVLPGHAAPTIALAFSPGGEVLVSGGDDRLVKVWNLNTGQETARLTNFLFWVGSVAFSPDGKILATGSADQTVKLWDTNQWQEITTLRGHEFEVWWVAFSPDGRKLITASKDDTIKVWDTSSRPEINLEKRPFAGTRDFAFSPDGKSLLLLHTNDSFSLIDTARWVETERRPLPLGSNQIVAAISNQGNLVLSADGGRIRVLDRAGLSEMSNFSISAPPVRWLLLSPDGKTTAVLNGRRDIELWDTASARLVAELEVGEGATCWDFSPDSGKLAIGGYDATVEIWDLPRKSKKTLPTGHEERIMAVAFSNDGRTLATASFDVHLLKLWDLETLRELATLGGQLAEFACIAFSPDDKRLAAGGNDGSVTLWDLTNRKPQEVAKLKGKVGRVQRLFFLPDGDTLVSLTDDRSLPDNRLVRVWHAPSWTEIEATEKADAKSQSP